MYAAIQFRGVPRAVRRFDGSGSRGLWFFTGKLVFRGDDGCTGERGCFFFGARLMAIVRGKGESGEGMIVSKVPRYGKVEGYASRSLCMEASQGGESCGWTVEVYGKKQIYMGGRKVER